MNVSARVRRLESRIEAEAKCPECRGHGKPGYELDFGCHTTGPKGGCRACGKISKLDYSYTPLAKDLFDAI